MKITIIKTWLIAFSIGVLGGCGATNPPEVSDGHLTVNDGAADSIPAPVNRVPVLPKPTMRPDLETYTVIVDDVPVRELLFSMARDAKLNLDIQNDIKGSITMNAIDQTLPKILQRMARQAPIRYKLEGDTLRVMADTPYLKTYNVSYLNIARTSSGMVEVSSEISSTGKGAVGGSSGGSGKKGNNSASTVENRSDNQFWKTLTANIANIIGENINGGKDDIKTSSNIIVNRESGMLAVNATEKQHEQISAFIHNVLDSVHRQVLIEATIAEVKLSDRYQAGIDWDLANNDPAVRMNQNTIGGNLGQSPFFSATLNDTISGNPLNLTLKALETFGDVKVLSSPKVMALNNQSAILKVVDNEVYFTIDVQTVAGNVNQNPTVAIDTNVNTVPVGFVMSVTPFIDDKDMVTLNVRPTISRIISTVVDPNPSLATAGVKSEIPVIQVREIETVLKINDGDTAVIGGLMQDQIDKKQSGVPILSSIPLLGALFRYQDDEYIKSELVIFIRPVVVHSASLTGDLKEYRKYLLEDLHVKTEHALKDEAKAQ
jgi:MSHA type pilus biogenesis protein MshL